MKIFYINLLISLFFFYCNFKFRSNISRNLKIIDFPDKKRKLHKKPVPLNGGLWFPVVLSIFCIEIFFLKNFLNHQIQIIIYTSIFMFLVGLADDRKSLNPNLRLFVYFIFFLIFVSLDENFALKKILFVSLDWEMKTSFFSYLFSAFCLTAFINSINLTDGINALANSLLLIILFFLYYIFGQNEQIIIILLILLIINSVLIFKGKYFLGDSGALGISTFVGMYVIYLYNLEYLGMFKNTFNAEDVFILMAFPGLDMIRVTFLRIINKKNPFVSGREHLHHYLLKKHSLIYTLMIYLIFAFLPAISNFILHSYSYTSYNLIMCFVLYIVLLKYSRLKNN